MPSSRGSSLPRDQTRVSSIDELDAQLHEAAPRGALQDEKMQEGTSDRQGHELSQAAVRI